MPSPCVADSPLDSASKAEDSHTLVHSSTFPNTQIAFANV